MTRKYPERKSGVASQSDVQRAYVQGWNACIKETQRLDGIGAERIIFNEHFRGSRYLDNLDLIEPMFTAWLAAKGIKA